MFVIGNPYFEHLPISPLWEKETDLVVANILV